MPITVYLSHKVCAHARMINNGDIPGDLGPDSWIAESIKTFLTDSPPLDRGLGTNKHRGAYKIKLPDETKEMLMNKVRELQKARIPPSRFLRHIVEAAILRTEKPSS